MPKLTYNWKRFWCPNTGQIIYDDRGFLNDPESEYGRLTNPDVVPFSAISDIPCLVLLGEAGIGKTTAIEQEYQQLKTCLSQTDDICLWFRLGDYSSDEALCNHIFRNNHFQAWIDGTHKLYLFLDSLDEGLLSIKILVRILKREIEKIHGDRLYFRITCRTADWPNSLEDKLKEKWNETNVGIYELAPLRQIDVLEAAQKNNISSDEFLQELINREAIPLALNPITLKFLLDTYRKDGQFPGTKKELYEKGCLQLCTEVNLDRDEAGFTGELTAKQRLIMAGRIAALTIFANRSAVWKNPELGKIPNSDIAIQDLLVGEESIDDQSTEVNKNCIKEVLSITGLFSSRGTHRMGFAHQTYAEFLAAWYLVQHQVPLVQVMSLLVAPGDPDRKLVPQLHETAAWLASMRTDIFEKIISTDPNVLLRSDIPKNSEIKAAIVTQLLQQYEEEKLLNYPDSYKYQGYKKLFYPTLHEELRPYIQDCQKKFDSRYEAITIASSCEIKDLQDDLVNLALNSSQPILLRVNAARAVCSVGNKNTKLKLKPLVIREIEEDKDDRLKGCILKALWPDCITAQELFSFITTPKRKTITGSYQIFFKYELVSNLQPTDLVIALNWVEQRGVRYFTHPFEELADAILLKAWEHFDIPGVAEAFAKIALIQWKEYKDIITNDKPRDQFKSFVIRDSQKRYTLIEKIIELLTNRETDSESLKNIETDSLLMLIHLREELVLDGDVLWMLTKINKNESETKQKKWSILIERSFDRQNAKEIDAILTATQINHVLREEFASYFEAIELSSDQAAKMKTYYKQMHDRENRSKNQPILEPSPTEQVTLLLKQLELGDLSAWWKLNLEMTLNQNSQYYNNELESDLTKLPGWQEANPETQQRIISGAQKYIQEQVKVTTDWIGTNQYDRPALAGCKAFQLLLKESPDLLNSISPAIWQRWAPVIIAYSHYDPMEPDYLELVKLAYRHAASEAVDTIIYLIDCQNKQLEDIFITRNLDRCWDEHLKTRLLEKAQDTALKPKSMGSLLEELIQQDFNEAREYAKSIISLMSLPSLIDETQRQKSLIAAKLLIQYADSSSWLAVWSAIQDNTDFGRQVIEDVAYYHSRSLDLNLTEKQLADFYIWLVRQYPHKEDSVDGNVGFIHNLKDVRQRIAYFRDSILTQLREKGTLASCLEIQRLVQELPELTWLKQVLLHAQNIRRHKDWCPPTTSAILQLVKNSEKRLVQDGNQLLDVLVEALQDLELELQGETPAVIDIWNDVSLNSKKPIYRPKGENNFSNHVKRFLDRTLKPRGAIVNREVELRAKMGSKEVGSPGERTDIHVDAVIRTSNGQVFDCITAIIEVKGCWHDDLSHAMETQLVNRYLKDNTCQHGLYLVGWFDCPQWDDKDSRKKKSPKISLEQARNKFNQQAEQLSKKNNVQVRAFVLNAALR